MPWASAVRASASARPGVGVPRSRDPRAGRVRIAGVRRTLAALAVVVIAIGAGTGVGAAGSDGGGARVTVPGRLSVRVPVGWHLLRGWLSGVIDPAPRLALASFPARLSRHTCACGFPNVVEFPRGGAFVFVWEYLRPSARLLARTPRRPARFSLARGGVRLTCDGPSNGFDFKDAGRVFQVEVYLGPRASPALRSQAAAVLASLHAASRPTHSGGSRARSVASPARVGYRRGQRPHSGG